MQPDSLNPQPEEKQSEPPTPLEAIKPEPSPVQTKKTSKPNIVSIVLGIFVFILLVVSTGMGILAYTLNSQLTSTQQQLSALQTEHEKLQTDYATLTSDNEKLTADLNQTKADLEKANADLSTAQGDLKKSQEQNKKLNDKLDKAGRLADVLYAWSDVKDPNDFFKIDALIKTTNDEQLIELWGKLVFSPNDKGFEEFFKYLIKSVRDNLE